MKQLSGFAAFSGMEDNIARLEDHVSAVRHEKKPVIYFEKNDALIGLHHITPLYETISAKKPLRITYQSFKNPRPETFNFSAYVLKEFRNRWLVFGRREGKIPVFNLALDRIVSIEPAPKESEFFPMGNFNPDTWFNDMIGVTKDRMMKPQKVVFKANPQDPPYIRTNSCKMSPILSPQNSFL